MRLNNIKDLFYIQIDYVHETTVFLFYSSSDTIKKLVESRVLEKK